jgi:oligoribonuclease NrnB/cAMP/cGMP phosphodiesterase (DHH superfamily)
MSFAKILVCYHFGCTDGTIAAYNFHRNILEGGEDNDVTYHAVGYQDGADLGRKENDLDDYDQIVFVDFCPNAPILRALLENEDRDVIILDHHATGKAVIKSLYPHVPTNLFYLIVDQLSGAGLVHSLYTKLSMLGLNATSDELREFNVQTGAKAYKYETVTGITNIDDIEYQIKPERMDRLTDYVCSRDLWLKDNDHKKGNYLDCYFKIHDLHNKHPSELEFLTNESDGVARAVIDGEAYMRFMEKTCAKQIEKSLQRIISYRGNELRIIIGITDTGYTSTFGEVGYSKDEIPTVVVGITPNFVTNVHGVSIRSSKELNVIRYAGLMFSGGGHRNASGGRLNCNAINPEQIMQNTIDLLAGIGDLFDHYD